MFSLPTWPSLLTNKGLICALDAPTSMRLNFNGNIWIRYQKKQQKTQRRYWFTSTAHLSVTSRNGWSAELRTRWNKSMCAERLNHLNIKMPGYKPHTHRGNRGNAAGYSAAGQRFSSCTAFLMCSESQCGWKTIAWIELYKSPDLLKCAWKDGWRSPEPHLEILCNTPHGTPQRGA